MNYIEIPNKGEFAIPSDWDELEQKQVSEILKLFVKLNLGQMNFDDFIVRSFYSIAGIKRNWLSVYRERLRTKQRNREKLMNTIVYAEFFTKFLFKSKETETPTKELYYNTVKNFFPEVKVDNMILLGPADFLQDITFGDFRKAIDAMNIFADSKSPDHLNHFFSILYRSDRSLPYNNDPRTFKLAAKVPYHIKLASYLWFTTCINYITTAEININGRSLSFAPLFPNNHVQDIETKKVSGLGWLSVLYGIAKEGVFGDADKADSRQLYDILLYMYDNHLQSIRLKLANKK